MTPPQTRSPNITSCFLLFFFSFLEFETVLWANGGEKLILLPGYTTIHTAVCVGTVVSLVSVLRLKVNPCALQQESVLSLTTRVDASKCF